MKEIPSQCSNKCLGEKKKLKLSPVLYPIKTGHTTWLSKHKSIVYFQGRAAKWSVLAGGCEHRAKYVAFQGSSFFCLFVYLFVFGRVIHPVKLLCGVSKGFHMAPFKVGFVGFKVVFWLFWFFFSRTLGSEAPRYHGPGWKRAQINKVNSK